MRIMYAGDLHIGQGARYGKTAENGLSEKMIEQGQMLDEFVERAIKENVDMVCLGGDYYPKHFRLDPTAVRIFTEPILKLSKAGIKTVLLLGNHDKARHESMDSNVGVFELFKVDNISVVGMPKIELLTDSQGNNVVMLYLPHLIPAELYKWQKNEGEGVPEIITHIVDDLMRQAEAAVVNAGWALTTPRILAGHFGLNEIGKGSESAMIANNNICFPASVLDRPGLNLAIFSHIHKFWVYKDSEYTKIVSIGSMDRFDFGELEKKKYAIIETTNDQLHLKTVTTKTHPFVIIKGDITNDTDIEKLLSAYDVDNAVVKVTLSADPSFINNKIVTEQIKQWLQDHNMYLLDNVAIIPKSVFNTHNQDITEESTVEDNVKHLLQERYPDEAAALFAKHLALMAEINIVDILEQGD